MPSRDPEAILVLSGLQHTARIMEECPSMLSVPVPVLTSHVDQTVFDDGEQDNLSGDGGRDWFLAGLTDNVTDQQIDEVLELL